MSGNSFVLSLSVLVIPSLVHCGVSYPPRYQPELDQLNLDKYIMDDYLFQMHVNCLFYDGPCDPVGRWMKPRMASYYLSSCILCTLNQEKEAEKFMAWLFENHPQLFRIGVKKYLDANGISLPANSKFKEGLTKMNVPKIAVSTEEVEEKKKEIVPAVPENRPQQEPIPLPLEERKDNGMKEDGLSVLPMQRLLKSPVIRRNKFVFGDEDDEAEMEFVKS